MSMTTRIESDTGTRDAHEARTAAQVISARFGDDGQRWTDAEGVHIEDVCAAEGDRVRNDERDCTRYVFGDGSAITIAGGGWDLGYAECSCWQGEGHDDRCEAAAETL